MKTIAMWALVVGLAMAAPAATEQEFGARLRADAVAFVQELDEAQRAACMRAEDRTARWKMQYTGGPREGLAISNVTAAARGRLEGLLRALLSDAGWRQAQAVALQDGPAGLGKYYVAFFGDPRAGDFALRVSEHHLTLVYLELKGGEVAEFGPILLGSDPPVLWQDEEQALLDLWKALGEAGPKHLQPGRAIASEPIKTDGRAGLRVGDLDAQARAALNRVWAGRLAFFSEPVRARVERLVAARGGLESLRMSYHNDEAASRCREGGRWDWKLAGEGVLLDFETSRKHIHMSLWIR